MLLIINNTLNKFICSYFYVAHTLIDSFQPPYIAVALFHFYYPLIHKAKKPDNYHRFITVEEEFTSYNFSANKSNFIKFKPSDIILKEITNYENVVVYFAIICRNNIEGKTDWTNSCGTFIKGIDNYFIACDESQRISNEKKESLLIPGEPVFNIRIK